MNRPLSHSMDTESCRKGLSHLKSMYLETFLEWLSAALPLGNGVSSCDTDFYIKKWCSYAFALNFLLGIRRICTKQQKLNIF